MVLRTSSLSLPRSPATVSSSPPDKKLHVTGSEDSLSVYTRITTCSPSFNFDSELQQFYACSTISSLPPSISSIPSIIIYVCTVYVSHRAEQDISYRLYGRAPYVDGHSLIRNVDLRSLD